MFSPTISPYVTSLIALSQQAFVAPTLPSQTVTRRPALPPGKSEMPRSRDKRDRDAPDRVAKGERGQETDVLV
jgi:hypothetical protein